MASETPEWLDSAPLGVLPFPAGLLAFEPAELADPVAAELREGRLPHDDLPASLRAALEGDAERAIALTDDRTPAGAVRAFALDATPERLAAARMLATGRLADLVELIAFTAGLRADPPEPHGGPPSTLGALERAARASWHVERGEHAEARAIMEDASACAWGISSALGALLDLGLVQAHLEEGDASESLDARLERATAALARTDLRRARGEAALARATLWHLRGTHDAACLRRAVSAYLEAAGLAPRSLEPDLWASVQVGLSAAYLALPMHSASDRLRAAVAISGLRQALDILDPSVTPARWCTAAMTLANALISLPTGMPGEHTTEALSLYERIAGLRRSLGDEAGAARAEANLGAALLALGAPGHAREPLERAKATFVRLGDTQGVRTVEEALAEADGSEREVARP